MVKIVFLFIAKTGSILTSNVQTTHKTNKLLNEIFWSDFVSFFLETYMEILISGILNA